MRIGLYGKLPSKRDFIALAASREFLGVWEPWIQGGMSASQVQLGDAWKAAYLRAPIWRFWLGADLCGETVLGAFMPSIDEIGRYFPLTVFVRSGAAQPLAPPEAESQSAWFDAAEALLLATLASQATFEATGEALHQLELPRIGASPRPRDHHRRLADGTVMLRPTDEDFACAFGSARAVDHGALYAEFSFWWTLGGDGFAPLALSRRRMPDPFLFAGLLTGDFPAPRPQADR